MAKEFAKENLGAILRPDTPGGAISEKPPTPLTLCFFLPWRVVGGLLVGIRQPFGGSVSRFVLFFGWVRDWARCSEAAALLVSPAVPEVAVVVVVEL